MAESREGSQENTEDKILDRDSFSYAWSTQAYLEDFYSGKLDEPAMRLIFCYLPSVVERLGSVQRVLDFAAGPTIHVAACFRKKAAEIHLADFLPQNRAELVRWRRGHSTFDWSLVTKLIASREGEYDKWPLMEDFTRHKVKAIYSCDMHRKKALPIGFQFDVVVTIFAVEYSCNTEEEYSAAISNICALIKPGGHFIMGGIMEETWCSFGGVKFSCLYLTERLLWDSLSRAGIDTTEGRVLFFLCDGMFLMCGKKLEETA